MKADTRVWKTKLCWPRNATRRVKEKWKKKTLTVSIWIA